MRKRDVEILTAILQDYSKEVSLGVLADRYQVTERTLRNDLRIINDYLKSLKMPEILIHSDGCFEFEGKIDASLVLKHLNKIDAYAYQMQMNERMDIILVILLTRSSYVTMQELAETLFVSRSSVIKDMNRLKEECVKRGLKLHSVLGSGFKIEAEETLCRKELFRIIRDNVTLETHTGGIFQHILLREMQFDISLEKIERMVRQNEKKRHVHLSDEGYVLFTCYLFVTANRIRNGRLLEESVSAARESKEDIAVEFFEDIMQELELPYTEKERSLIRRETQDWNLILKNGFDEEYIVLENSVAEFIHALSGRFQTDFFEDRNLFDLILYFIGEIRQKNKIRSQENSFFPQIMEKYPEGYNIVAESSKIFEKSLRLKLYEEDIAYLTMHVAAAGERLNHFRNRLQVLIVCPGNMATGQLLQAQVERHFSYKIKAVCSVRDLYDEEWFEDVDMVISTVPIWDIRRPVITVNPLLRLEDIQHIQEIAFQLSNKREYRSDRNRHSENVLDRIQMLLQREKSQAQKEMMISRLEELEKNFRAMCAMRHFKLRDLLSPDTVEIVERCDSWESAIRRAGHMLVRKGKITGSYISSCIENCKVNGPYFVLSDGLAIAHTHPKDGLIDPGVSLLFIRQGVSFQHKAYGPVRLLFFICLKEPNNELLKLLINCAKNHQLVKSLEKEENGFGLYQILSDYEIRLERKEKL